MRRAWPLLLLLAACGSAKDQVADTPGARLEAAAVARGLVPDTAHTDMTGAWARDTDRVCVGPPRDDGQRIGVSIDYGEGQGCGAAGILRRTRDRLSVDLGGDCRFDARFDGERIAFPADLPTACERLCTGRATLAAVAVEQVSTSASEAATLRDHTGRPLCPTS